jgi:hypothetical protein
MIQFDLNNALHPAYLDIEDAINGSVRPLVKFTSQQTDKSKIFIPTLFTTSNKARYCTIIWLDGTPENLTSGLIDMGNTDFPLGYYDVTIYKNTSNSNLDTSVATPVYYTILNMFDSTKAPTTFNKYSNNDTDTNSVYITF